MSRFSKSALAMMCCSVAAWSVVAANGLSPEFFSSPSAPFRPWTYWLWQNGNVSERDVTRDLESIKRLGFGGVLMFDNRGYGYTDGLPPVQLQVMTEPWFDLVAFSIRECARLGLEFEMNASSSGGSLGGFMNGKFYEVDITDPVADIAVNGGTKPYLGWGHHRIAGHDWDLLSESDYKSLRRVGDRLVQPSGRSYPAFLPPPDCDRGIGFCHRRDEGSDTDIYFVTGPVFRNVYLRAPIAGRRVELWDPVSGIPHCNLIF